MAEHYPSGPLDPMAAGIAGFFAADPGWQALTATPVAETRASVRAATPVLGTPEMAHVEDLSIPVTDGAILVRWYQPKTAAQAIIVWSHGGGFSLGSADEIDNFARVLAETTSCVVASVEYRLAPEFPFPTAVEDVEAAVRHICQHHIAMPVFVGGDSAGANLSTVVTRRLHAEGACRIVGNILAYPCTDHAEAESLRRFEAPFLGVKEVGFFLGQYQSDPARNEHPDYAPLYAADLSGLPPTLLLTAEHDVITEQAEAYGDKLAAAGVIVERKRYAGMIHGFVTMDAFFPTAAGEAMRDIDAFIRQTIA